MASIQSIRTVVTNMDKTKILFLAANPSDRTRLRVEEEVREIDEALRKAEFRDKFEIEKCGAVRISDLQTYLLRYKPDVVHFSGHGNQASELIFEDHSGSSKAVSIDALSKLFYILKGDIQCIILNACYTEQQAIAIAEHINYVIGMSNAITDRSAISFASAFYQAIGFGKDIQTAFNLGCIELELADIDGQHIPKLITHIDPYKNEAKATQLKTSVITRWGTNIEQFIYRLSEAERVTIIGITNQNLVQYLEKALTIKQQREYPNSFWEGIRIVFLSETILNTIDDELRTEYSDKDNANFIRTRKAGKAKRAISYFLIRAQHPRNWSLYEYDASLPFVGALYEMPGGQKIVEIATLRPYFGQSDLLYFEFLDQSASQVIGYYQNIFEEIIQQSTKHDEIVIVGNPLSQSNGFVWQHSKFRRSVLEPNPHNDDWIAVIMALLWRKNEKGNVEPLLQIRTPENATRELDTLSNIAGYINQLDCRDFDSIRSRDVVLQKSAFENAVYRELQEELGIKHNWLEPKIVDEIRFYYPDKENLYFYVCQLEIDFPLFHVESSAYIRPWTFSQLLKIREYQVLSKVFAVLQDASEKTIPLLAVNMLVHNLLLHRHAELAEKLSYVFQFNLGYQELQREVQTVMEQCSEYYMFRNDRHLIRGFAELQYREFFSTLTPAYSMLGVLEAQEYQKLITNDVNLTMARDKLKEFYGDLESIRKVEAYI